MTRNEWKQWYSDLVLGRQWDHPDVLNSIADLGEQVDTLLAVRRAAFPGLFEGPDLEDEK